MALRHGAASGRMQARINPQHPPAQRAAPTILPPKQNRFARPLQTFRHTTVFPLSVRGNSTIFLPVSSAKIHQPTPPDRHAKNTSRRSDSCCFTRARPRAALLEYDEWLHWQLDERQLGNFSLWTFRDGVDIWKLGGLYSQFNEQFFKRYRWKCDCR